MALGAEYKVNIKLDTKEFDAQLKTLQTKVNNIGKAAVRGGRGGAKGGNKKGGLLGGLLGGGDKASYNAVNREATALLNSYRKVLNAKLKTANIEEASYKFEKATDGLQRGKVKYARQLRGEFNLIVATKKVGLAVEKQNTEELRKQSTLRSKIGGSVRQIGSPAFATRGARMGGPRTSIEAKERLRNQQTDIRQRADYLETAFGGPTSGTRKLRREIGKLSTLQGRTGQMGAANRQLSIVRRVLRVEEGRLKVTRERIRLEKEANRVKVQEFNDFKRATRLKYGTDRMPVRGGVDIPGSPKQIEAAQAKSNRKLNTRLGLLKQISGFRSKINKFELDTLGNAELTSQLDQVRINTVKAAKSVQKGNYDLAAKQLTVAKTYGNELSARLVTEKGITKEANRRYRDAERERKEIIRNSPKMPVSGRLVTGGYKEGSPGWKKQEQNEIRALRRQARIEYGADMNTGGFPVMGRPGIVGSPAWYGKVGAMKGNSSMLNYVGGQLMPGPRAFGGRMGFDRGGALSSALISGAFPLLFGQGPVTAAAGALGGGLGQGFLGGQAGFAGGLAATAAVTAISTAVSSLRNLGEALTTTAGTIDLMKERSLFSSDAVQRQAEALQKAGMETELNTLLTKELAASLGIQGVRGLQELGQTSKEAAKEWGILTTQLQLLLAGPLKGIIEILNNVVSKFTVSSQIGSGIDAIAAKDPKKAMDLVRRMEKTRTLGENIAGGSLTGGQNIPSSRLGMFGPNLGGLSPERMSEMLNMVNKEQERLGITPGKLDFKDTGAKESTRLTDLQEEIDFLEKSLALGTERAEIESKAAKIFEEQKLLRGEDLDITREQIVKELEKEAALKKQIELYQNIRNIIEQGIGNAIEGLIRRTKTLSEALADIAGSLGRAFLNAGINAIVGSFTGGAGPWGGAPLGPKGNPLSQHTDLTVGVRNSGGPVSGGSPYLVGESGPELFIPGSNGQVTSNNALRMESSMGRYNSGSGGSVTVNYTGPMLNFNGDEYVPRSAVGEIITTATAQGAKAGENRTLATLRNSRSTRSRLGM